MLIRKILEKCDKDKNVFFKIYPCIIISISQTANGNEGSRIFRVRMQYPFYLFLLLSAKSKLLFAKKSTSRKKCLSKLLLGCSLSKSHAFELQLNLSELI